MTDCVESLGFSLSCHSFPYLYFFFLVSFLTRLSSPPSFLVRSDCPAFLTFLLRMLEIPSSCCGLAKSLQLLFLTIPLSFNLLLFIYLSTSGLHWMRQTWLHCQDHTLLFAFFLTLYLPFCLSIYLSVCRGLIQVRESDRATWQPVRPWDRPFIQQCKER